MSYGKNTPCQLGTFKSQAASPTAFSNVDNQSWDSFRVSQHFRKIWSFNEPPPTQFPHPQIPKDLDREYAHPLRPPTLAIKSLCEHRNRGDGKEESSYVAIGNFSIDFIFVFIYALFHICKHIDILLDSGYLNRCAFNYPSSASLIVFYVVPWPFFLYSYLCVINMKSSATVTIKGAEAGQAA